MRVDEEDGSIDITIEEAIKLNVMGFILVCNDGKVVAIVEEKHKKET